MAPKYAFGAHDLYSTPWGRLQSIALGMFLENRLLSATTAIPCCAAVARTARAASHWATKTPPWGPGVRSDGWLPRSEGPGRHVQVDCVLVISRSPAGRGSSPAPCPRTPGVWRRCVEGCEVKPAWRCGHACMRPYPFIDCPARHGLAGPAAKNASRGGTFPRAWR